MKAIIFLLVLLSSVFVSAQDRYIINGKVVSIVKNLEGIYVENVSSGEVKYTDDSGYFDIWAKVNDTLLFSSPSFLGYQHVLSLQDINRDMVLFPMEVNAGFTMLDEIRINKISAESLGLVPKGVRRYTPAERRLYTATSGGGLIPIDAIVNWISGRTKMLKKSLNYERHENRKEKILNNFSEERLINDYSIPKDYVQGFAYYVSYDEAMMGLLNASTFERERVESRLGELAMVFIEMLAEKQLEESQSEKP